MEHIKNVIVYTLGGIILAIVPIFCVLMLFTGDFNFFVLIIYSFLGSLSALCLIKASVHAGNEQKWQKPFHLVMLTIIFFPIGLWYLWQKDHNLKKLGIVGGAILLLLVFGIAKSPPKQDTSIPDTSSSVDRNVAPNEDTSIINTTVEET